MPERRQQLIHALLDPGEQKWLGRTQAAAMIPRIKQLRIKMVPKLINADTTQETKNEIWSDLARLYVAQQVGSYPAGYLDHPSETRLLETVERLEEDITDRVRIHRPLHVILQVDRAIEVDTDKTVRGAKDPVMEQLATRLQAMLDQLQTETRPWS